MNSRPVKGPTIVVFVVAALSVFGAWPGWLSGTSLALQEEAISGAVTDWGPPLLIWSWSQVGASTLGPLIPFLLQEAAFWVGIALVTWVLSGQMKWWAVLLPLASYFVDHLWAIHWVEKDGAVLATTVLSLGVFAVALDSSSAKRAKWLTTGAIFIISLGVVARWYMLPVIAIGATTYALAVLWRTKKNPDEQRSGSKAKSFSLITAFLGVFLIGALGPLVLERIVVTPIPSYHSSSIKFLDLWRAECLSDISGTGATSTSADASKFPPALVIRKEQSICTNFNPNVWNTVKDALPGVTHVRLPANEAEVAELNERWQQVLISEAPLMAYARFGLALNLLGLSEYWMTLGSVEKVATGEARLTIARAPATMLAAGDTIGNILRNGALYVVFLPLLLAIVLVARGYRSPFWIYLGLTFPLMWVINFVIIGPANDTRYISTGVGWSVIFAFIAIAFRHDYARKGSS